jgi:hypothetical protein
MLSVGAAQAQATCIGDPVAELGPPTSGAYSDFTSAQAHVGGRWYFEATASILPVGADPVPILLGVFASPMTDLDVENQPPLG